MPELARIREILGRPGLFTVVQDLYLTETAALADVVLPAATWGEKTGAFTNADRTVHLSDKAAEPPGEARADLEIFLDYARRMDFRDKDGDPLIDWHDAESAFEAWKACSKGRPCDYSGLSHAKLRATGSGIQWPCTEELPEGTERLYTDRFNWAAAETCESYGKDLETGAGMSETEYRALNPQGKALLRAAKYTPPHEEPDENYPLHLTTGRTIFHFHTRTKTARAPELNAAAPEPWIEISASEAARQAVAEGDLAEVRTPRGAIRARVRVTDMRDGLLFVPFHYGYWDVAEGAPRSREEAGRAANETTITDWDPVSKQPLFKTAAARIVLIEKGDGTPAPAPLNTASAPGRPGGDTDIAFVTAGSDAGAAAVAAYPACADSAGTELR